MKAKFQVYDGVGPTEVIAVVSPAAEGDAFTGIVQQEGATLDCSKCQCEVRAKCYSGYNG
ncbi:MAG: hypothetical protein ACLT1J_01205 [Mediterraneibacter gnavus]